MSLTETFLRKSKVTKNRQYDRGGLYIQANKTKTKYRYWRLKYYRPTDHKEDLLALGTYPEISLSEARRKTVEARTMVAKGIDPKQQQKAAKALSKNASKLIFEAIALKVVSLQQLSESSQFKKISRFKNYVFPYIGKKPIDQISTPELAQIVRNVYADGKHLASAKYETARKVRRELDQVFTYATQMGYVTTNNAQNLKGIIPKSPVKHKPAITDPKPFGELLKRIDSYQANSVVGAALRLAPLVFQRPTELVSMEWEEINFDKKVWEIPPEKKKERIHLTGAHIVPLSQQAIAIIKSLTSITGGQKYVFNSLQRQDKHISTASVIKALRAIGYDTKTEQTIHGFRASARTMIEEQLNVPYTIIEMQLSHSVRDTHGRAYNRTQFLNERRKMMQKWADYCDELRDS